VQPERWKRGVDLVNALLGDEIGKVYVEKHFGLEAKRRMDQLVTNLVDAYDISISAAKWLKDETKTKALEKLNKFTPKIGFPSQWVEYPELKTSSDLVANILAIHKAQSQFWMAQVGEKVNRELWEMSPQTVNAYYSPLENKIVFPAAILQPPFFGVDSTEQANYGGIGVVIGHEIGHGFDDQGSQYDGDGNLENWWTEEDRTAFEKITEKLVGQFDSFSPRQLPDEFHVNGKLTLGENIGDLSGLKISLLALAKAEGFETVEQLIEEKPEEVKEFFFQYALIWRAKVRDEMTKQLLVMDPHSPVEFRANAVRNIDAFHQVFETSQSDDLYLAESERVDIW
jgi:predicted metalloendopeptidase